MNSNPLRREQDAFKIVLVVGAAGALVALVAAIFGSVAAGVLATAFVVYAFYRVALWIREAISEPGKLTRPDEE